MDIVLSDVLCPIFRPSLALLSRGVFFAYSYICIPRLDALNYRRVCCRFALVSHPGEIKKETETIHKTTNC